VLSESTLTVLVWGSWDCIQWLDYWSREIALFNTPFRHWGRLSNPNVRLRLCLNHVTTYLWRNPDVDNTYCYIHSETVWFYVKICGHGVYTLHWYFVSTLYYDLWIASFCQGGQIKNYEECRSVYGRISEMYTIFWLERPMERDHLQDIRLDGR
jgi:hypothetical protein